jgi:hypothetical protein
MNYITGRWKNNDYKHEQLFTGFKKDGTIKMLTKTSKRKPIKQRWVSQAIDTFEIDINMINEHVQGQLEATPFPKEMLPLSRNWSILRSDANLDVSQEGHTHLVPEYGYVKETRCSTSRASSG